MIKMTFGGIKRSWRFKRAMLGRGYFQVRALIDGIIELVLMKLETVVEADLWKRCLWWSPECESFPVICR
jgi:hypothetical protein